MSPPFLAPMVFELGPHAISVERGGVVSWSAGGRVTTAALKELYERNQGDGRDPRERFRIGTDQQVVLEPDGAEELVVAACRLVD